MTYIQYPRERNTETVHCPAMFILCLILIHVSLCLKATKPTCLNEIVMQHVYTVANERLCYTTYHFQDYLVANKGGGLLRPWQEVVLKIGAVLAEDRLEDDGDDK